MFREQDLNFGKSKLSADLISVDNDDDVQSDRETINNAKLGLEFDLRDAIKDFCGAKRKIIKNLVFYH